MLMPYRPLARFGHFEHIFFFGHFEHGFFLWPRLPSPFLAIG
ncbi:hypothetical protein [Methyloceanibacter stevinii]|nr:hypothetical protein [Methyloceanibacter stevinii]